VRDLVTLGTSQDPFASQLCADPHNGFTSPVEPLVAFLCAAEKRCCFYMAAGTRHRHRLSPTVLHVVIKAVQNFTAGLYILDDADRDPERLA
jgi:hypothetical protein